LIQIAHSQLVPLVTSQHRLAGALQTNIAKTLALGANQTFHGAIVFSLFVIITLITDDIRWLALFKLWLWLDLLLLLKTSSHLFLNLVFELLLQFLEFLVVMSFALLDTMLSLLNTQFPLSHLLLKCLNMLLCTSLVVLVYLFGLQVI
jgi:hypothetical protein